MKEGLNMKKMKVAILGFGQRGYVFADIIRKHADEMELVAVCENNLAKKPLIMREFGIIEENYYTDYHQMFEKGKLADILVVSTMDRDHYQPTMKALDLGYDILLEKPIAPTKAEILAIQAKANALNRKIAVAHVLRYTPFYLKLKEIIDEGVVGDIVTLSQTEHVGYFHYAHSYVRGNWRKVENSTPMIMAKSCHDLDIIKFLINKKCEQITSFGGLYHFKQENAPVGSSDYCYKCQLDCPYNAVQFYENNPMWMSFFSLEKDAKKVLADENLSYAKCVYKSDNDVVDHQVVNMLFAGGTTASFTMTAFSNETHRSIKIHGTKAEIEADLEVMQIEIKPYGKQKSIIDVRQLADDFSYHSGGDNQLFVDFVRNVRDHQPVSGLTDINNSIESHFMALDAEESRKNNGKVIRCQIY